MAKRKEKCKIILQIFCILTITKLSKGFVNSPKIITNDGNLIFESGQNRNISFRLMGQSRLTINDKYDILDLVTLKKRIWNGTTDGSLTLSDFDLTTLQPMNDEVKRLRTLLLGPNGISDRLNILQNRSSGATQNLRSYRTRLQRLENRLQTLTTRLGTDNCKSNPCENGGTCYNMFDGFLCKCTKNFEGPTCSKDVNECALFAGTDLGCQNGAQCVNQFGSYNCICAPGWYGMHCTQRNGDCSQSSNYELCAHGTCVPSGPGKEFGYKCICDPGWKTNGLTPICSTDVDECSESHPPCMTKCINQPGSFTCAPCPPGLEGNGMNCRDVDECSTNNGGCSTSPMVRCINTYGSFHCGECPLGWSGDGRNCMRTSSSDTGSISSCSGSANICHPAAKCIEISNTVVCSCPLGMTGNGIGPNGCVSSVSSTDCGGVQCLNGGTCVESGPGIFTCVCLRGFRPPNCAVAPDPCRVKPCHNNGRCYAVSDTEYQCQCMPGYTGSKCDTALSQCGGIMAGETGHLKYPQGSLYEHNSQCAWLLKTNESMVLNVTFNAFELEDADECRFDWLQINDGRSAAQQVIGRFCGLHKPNGGNIISSTNYLYLWFRSDNSTAKAGFDLSWNSIPPQCGGVIDVISHGTIASPGSPGRYPKNRDCRWHLKAPNDKRIKLTFFSLQIENHDSCNYDYVEITDAIADVQLEKLCNSTNPLPILLPTNEAIIHFHSDNQGSDTGFQIYYSLEGRTPGCGGTFSAKEGIIKSPIRQADQELLSCEYDIRLSTSEIISITFIKFDMGTGECIEIYDVLPNSQNTSAPSTKALQLKYCGEYPGNPPFVFLSQYNAVQIKYYGSSKVTSGFELKYESNCHMTFSSPIGIIESPGYPNMEKAERYCSYKISLDPGNLIVLDIVDFDLRDSSVDGEDCTQTYLKINDGLDRNLMGPFCGEKQPPTGFISANNMLTLTFQNSPHSSGKGFKLNYRSTPAKIRDCGGVFTKPGDKIRLPTNEAGQYLNDLTCYWYIMAPVGKGIMLKFDSFDLEDTFDCLYDYVEIFDSLASRDKDKSLARFCSLRKPTPILTYSSMLVIKFVSDIDATASGFQASYEFIDVSKQCGGTILSSEGVITSPGFPQNYSTGIDCDWIIKSALGTQVELKVEVFELENSTDCANDWLEIRNGGSPNSTLVGYFCGNTIPRAIPSFSNQIRLHFHSDNFGTASGFRISWEAFSNGCGGLLKAELGVITSPAYPENYPENTECEWKISVNKGSVIHINFEDIEIESLFNCAYDYLEIFDGFRETVVPLVRRCEKLPGKDEIATTRNEAIIRFRTDGSNSGRGFLLSYYANCTRVLSNIHGTIESPNYGKIYYRRDVNCAWTIKAPKGNHIDMEFTYLDSSDKNAIIYLDDYLKNGTTVSHRIKGTQVISSVGEKVIVRQNSSSISFHMDYRVAGCVGDFRRETGEFESPNYPSPYLGNLDCSWTIHAPVGEGIEVTIHSMDVEDSVNCTRDAIVITQTANDLGHNKERHCGKQENFVITSSSHVLYVRFITDDINNGKGFTATYRFVKSTCGGVLSTKSGVIYSPNYPTNYPPNADCEWNVEVSPHHTLNLTLEDIDLEDLYDCYADYLEAYNVISDDLEETDASKQLFKRCTEGEDTVNTWTSASNAVMVHFKSDDSQQSKGFKLSYQENCGGDLIISSLDLKYIDLRNNAESNETCVWHLKAENSTARLELLVTHVLLTQKMAMMHIAEESCQNDGIKIFEGTDDSHIERSKFCIKHPPAIISHGNGLTVSVPLATISEFEATVMLLDEFCGGSFTGLTGSFASPNYPSPYPPNIDCEWNIVASEGNSVVLTIESIDLEESDDCNDDFLEIRENEVNGTLLGVFCGKNLPPPLGPANVLHIIFRSANDNVGTGFKISYNYVLHNEVKGKSGIIESPRYPSKFHSNDLYSWRISVSPEYVVLLNIKNIVDVDMPFITFYDGYSDIGPKIDYSQSNVVQSNTNFLFITARRGPFKFEWEQLSKEAVRDNQTAVEASQECGKSTILIDGTTYFTSPGYPDGYKHSLECFWTIVPANKLNHVVAEFLILDLEDFDNCGADYVKVESSKDLSNWNELGQICRKVSGVDNKYSGTPYLRLNFHTDSSVNQTGFHVTLKTQCGSELNDQRGIVNITEIARTQGAFNMECIWTIKARQGRRVRITFLESQLKSNKLNVDDCGTFFIVRNGINHDSPFLGTGKFCNNDITEVLESTSNVVYVKFKQSGIGPRFRLTFHYEEILHPCSDEITLSDDIEMDKWKVITSPKYPNLPDPHTECVWKITAPPHHIIAVHFLDKFELSADKSAAAVNQTVSLCEEEYVQLNDGATELMPLIGRYCGTARPDTQYTTNNILRMTYFTDVAEPKTGFKANVSIGLCGGLYYSDEGTIKGPISNTFGRIPENGLECVYTIETFEDSTIEVTIESLKMSDGEGDNDNCNDRHHLELQEIYSFGGVDNMTDSLKLCGEKSDTIYIVDTNKLRMIYRLRDNSYRTEPAFIVKYKSLGTRCGQTLFTSAGVLQTPGYPHGVRIPIHCIWRITVPKGKRVKVEFLDFDLGTQEGHGLTHHVVTYNPWQPPTFRRRSQGTFRGRIIFSNDFSMQSIITRVYNKPSEAIYSTDNLMSIDVFLMGYGTHRGIKLRFTSEEDSIDCRSKIDVDSNGIIEFKKAEGRDIFCYYRVGMPTDRTLVLSFANYQTTSTSSVNDFSCKYLSPFRLELPGGTPLLPDLMCKNSTEFLDSKVRIPFSVNMKFLSTNRNGLNSLDINYMSYSCGGIISASPFMSENVTINQKDLPRNHTGNLECAWAVRPISKLVNILEEGDLWQYGVQLELTVSTKFQAPCEEEYLLIYNGPDQNSPHLGRYCGEKFVSNIIVEKGILVEYFSLNYTQTSSGKFNISLHPGSGCGGELTYPFRTINFGSAYYKNNVECIWDIKADDGFHLQLSFIDRFFIESSDDCKKDTLDVERFDISTGNWTLMKKLCGREPPKMLDIPSSKMRLVFRSDADKVGDGFTAKLDQYCGGVFYASEDTKTLQSPGYPDNYPMDLVCNYTILAPNSSASGALVRFTDFSLESSPLTRCLFDNVTVVAYGLPDTEPVTSVICGMNRLYEYRAKTKLEIILRTDHSFSDRGFMLEYSTRMCGGVVTNSTVIETPHNHNDDKFPENSNCFWNITAPANHKILIKFEYIDFESSSECLFDSVEIYSGNYPAEDQRLAKFCGNITHSLPIVSVNKTQALIRSHSDDRDPSRGFKALVSFVQNCDKVIYLEDSAYQLKDFEDGYANNLHCAYVFRTTPDRQIQIDFDKFHIENSTNCAKDYLEIRDGAGSFANEIGHFCGHEAPQRLMSSRHTLYMLFVSDAQETSSGFSAYVRGVPLYCGRHDIKVEKSVTLKSPEFDEGHYPKNLNCFWKLKSENNNLHLKFNALNIQNPKTNGSCEGNYLQIYKTEDADYIEHGYGKHVVENGERKLVNFMDFATEFIFCGNRTPDDYFPNSHEVFVKFRSNGDGAGSGFSLTATEVDGCFKNFTGIQGRIHFAETRIVCDVYIKSPENYTVSVYFSTLSFAEYNCDQEYIEVFDAKTNSSLKKFCNYVDPGSSIFSRTNELRLRFKTDGQYTEYDMTYLASKLSDGPGCGGTLFNTQGIITSPFYPEAKRNNSDCSWSISVPTNLNVYLRFDTFNMGAKVTCHSDYLQILEVDEQGNENVERQFCGGDNPRAYKSTRSSLRIHYRKSVNFNGIGWVVSFSGVHTDFKIPAYLLDSD